MITLFMMHPLYIIIYTKASTGWSYIVLHIFSNSLFLMSVAYKPKKFSDKISLFLENIELISKN